MMLADDPRSYMTGKALCILKGEFTRRDLGEVPRPGIPPEGMGDLSFPLFEVAKTKKVNPVQISKEVVEELNKKNIDDSNTSENKGSLVWKSAGPYINEEFSRDNYSKLVLESVH